MLSLTLDAEAFASRRRKAQTDLEERLTSLVRESIENPGWDAVVDLAADLLAAEYESEAGQPLSRSTERWQGRIEDTLDKGSYDSLSSVKSTALWLATAILTEATILAATDDEEDLFLEWVDMHDNAVRPAHREASGQVRPIGEKFTVGGVEMTGPGDVTAPIGLWAACRCTLRPRLANEFKTEGTSMNARHRATFASCDKHPCHCLGCDEFDCGLDACACCWVYNDKDELVRDFSGRYANETITASGGTVTKTTEGLGVPCHGVLAPEGVWSGDKRRFAPGALSTRPLPLPFTWQKVSADGHDGNVTVSMIEDAFTADDLVYWEGRFLSTVPEADEAIGLIAEFGKFGVSVDADSSTFEIDEEAEGINYLSARIASACMLPIPAFAEAYVALGPLPDDIKKKRKPMPGEEGEKPPEADVPEEEMLKPDDQIPTTPDGAPAIKDDEPDPKKKRPFPVAARQVDSAERDKLKDEDKALPDGSFPIANADDLRNAIRAIGRAKDPDAAKAHIKRRAKTLGMENAIPDGWTLEEMAARAETFVDVAPGKTEDGPGWLTNPVDTDRIRDYWVSGPGAAKIGWGSPGDFNRCRVNVAEYVKPQHLNGYCANRHFDALGFWPGRPVGGDTIPFAAEQLDPDGKPGPALSIVASVGISAPTDWFDDPGFALGDGRVVEVSPGVHACPHTITDDGQVFGHIAAWGACHLNSRLAGECTVAPHNTSGYREFLNSGVVRREDGSVVPVGQITLGGGHAGDGLSMRAAIEHYDNAGSAVCDITVGEDVFGIWYSGWIRPGTTPEQVTALRASAISGDWRELPLTGEWEMIAALAVNVPGLGIPRTRVGVRGGRQVSLVASGIVAPSEESRDKVVVELDEMGIDYDTLAVKIAEQLSAVEDRRATMRALAARFEPGDFRVPQEVL